MRSADGAIPALDKRAGGSDSAPARRGFASLIGGTRHPRTLLTCLVLMIYWPALLQSFAVDDYRNLRLLGEYQRSGGGLRLYEFLRGGDDNQQQRQSGVVPWWVSDGFRFRYFRPVTETVLLAEYRVFGARPLGYHAFSIFLYAIGAWLVLALFRDWTGDEVRARWGAVAFTVAASNAVPAAFIAAQCDLLALIASVGAVLCAARYIRGGTFAWAVGGALAFAIGLLSKEAGLPAAVLPFVYAATIARRQGEGAHMRAVSHREEAGHGVGGACPPLPHGRGSESDASMGAGRRREIARRALMAGMPLVVMSGALIAFYGARQYGSNGSMILDPIGHPAEFLLRMPGRAIMLLSSWLAPVNPQWFDLFDWLRPWGIVFLACGSIGLLILLTVLVKRHRHDPTLRVFAFWSLPFLPLLACTNPDNRVMMLPAVGLSMVAAVLMTPAGAMDGHPRISRLPVALFVVIPFMFSSGTVGSLGQLEREAAKSIRAGVDSFERPVTRSDFVFYLNSYWQFDAIWSQDRADYLNGPDGPRVAYLSHMPDTDAIATGPRTLRLTARANPFFSTYPGRLVLTRDGAPPSAGMKYDAGEYTATLQDVRDGRVWAVDFEFRAPLNSPHYRFIRLHYWNPPARWIPATASPEDHPGSK